MSWGSLLCCPPKAWADRVKESDITTPCMKLSSIKRDAIVDGNLVVADLADEWLDGCTHVKGFLKAHRELSKSKSRTVKLCNMAGNMQEVLTFMRAHDQPMAPSFHLLALKASYLQVLTKCGPQGLAWLALSTLFDNGVVGVLKEMAEDRSVGSSGVSPGGWLQGVVLPAVAMAIDGWGAEGDGVNVEPWIGDLASTVEALTSCGDILAEGPDLLTPVSALLTLVRASLTPPVVSAAEVSAAKILVTTDPKLSTWKAALERSEGGGKVAWLRRLRSCIVRPATRRATKGWPHRSWPSKPPSCCRAAHSTGVRWRSTQLARRSFSRIRSACTTTFWSMWCAKVLPGSRKPSACGLGWVWSRVPAKLSGGSPSSSLCSGRSTRRCPP